MPALLLYGDTERSPSLRHEIPIAIGDGLLFADVEGRTAILTSWLERDRIAAVLPHAEILEFNDLGMRALVEEGMTRLNAEREVVLRAVRQLGIAEAIIPGDFPVAIADRLRADGITVAIDDDAVAVRRRVKAGAELDGIRPAEGPRTPPRRGRRSCWLGPRSARTATSAARMAGRCWPRRCARSCAASAPSTGPRARPT